MTFLPRCASFLLLACTTLLAQSTPRYSVTVPADNIRLARIEAHLPVLSDTLMMSPEYAEGFPDRYAKWVRGLVASDESGKSVALQYLGEARWKIPAPLPRQINLSYDVVLDHDKEHWEFGPKEAAYSKPGWALYTGRALFIGDPGLRGIEVEFHLPASWEVTAPWADLRHHAYSVPNSTELTQVVLALGQYSQRTVRVGDTQVTIALGRDLAPAMDLFESALKPLLPAASSVFGGTPRGKFVILANRDTYDSGGAFIRSVSMVFKTPPTADAMPGLAHFLGHEMIHLWVGQTIIASDEEHEYWLSEGFTDYLAYQLLVRTGTITNQELAEQVALQEKSYRAQAGKISMREGGKQKDKYYDLVYSGGFLTALALDAQIRKNSHGTRSFDTLLARMYHDYGVTDHHYSLDELVALSSEVAGTDLTAFFRDYVRGTQVLSASPYLADLGLAHAGTP